MGRTIDYYLTASSPWTCLGHDLFVDLAGRHWATIRWRPISLPVVFPETGGLPLPKRAPERQRYRLVELRRWRELRGLPINLQPAHFPADPSLADRTAIALDAAGADPAGFLGRAMRALWVYDRDIAEPRVIEALLADAGFEARETLSEAETEATAAAYERNSKEAIAAGVFGAPTYMLDGEPFWGQDRLDLLELALESGRAPYRA